MRLDRLAKLIIKKFNPKKELKHLNLWLLARGIPKEKEETLPKCGLVAYKDGMPVATAFLRKCEGDVAMLEALCTNPCATSSDRHTAIDALVCRIIDIANNSGINKLIAFSIDDGTIKRSLKHGFEQSPFSLIFKDLSAKAELCQ